MQIFSIDRIREQKPNDIVNFGKDELEELILHYGNEKEDQFTLERTCFDR